jgi:inner membrane protein
LLTLAILAWRRHSARLATYALLWFTAYASLGVWQHARAERSLRSWLAAQQVVPERLAVKPTISNLFVWRAVWLRDGRWQVAAVRNLPFTDTRLVLGETRAAWSAASAGNPPPFSEGAHVIADFSRFTGGWNTYDAQPGAILIGDIRFAMLPTSSKPLWSVRCAPGGTLADTTLVMDRNIQDGDWSRLGALLSGSDPRFIVIE